MFKDIKRKLSALNVCIAPDADVMY